MAGKMIRGIMWGQFVIVCLIIICVVGWVMNISKLADLDFEKPYKAEILRCVGVPFVPVGGVIGYMSIGEEDSKKD